MKKILISSLVIALASCGFQPLYSKQGIGENSIVVSEQLSKVGVKVSCEPNNRIAQKTQAEIEDIFYRKGEGDKKYSLKVKITPTKDAIGIQQDRTVTRFNVRLNAEYTLADENGVNIDTGSSFAAGSFDAVTSDFGTYSLEKDTELNLTETIARNIAANIASKLSK